MSPFEQKLTGNITHDQSVSLVDLNERLREVVKEGDTRDPRRVKTLLSLVAAYSNQIEKSEILNDVIVHLFETDEINQIANLDKSNIYVFDGHLFFTCDDKDGMVHVFNESNEDISGGKGFVTFTEIGEVGSQVIFVGDKNDGGFNPNRFVNEKNEVINPNVSVNETANYQNLMSGDFAVWQEKEMDGFYSLVTMDGKRFKGEFSRIDVQTVIRFQGQYMFLVIKNNKWCLYSERDGILDLPDEYIITGHLQPVGDKVFMALKDKDQHFYICDHKGEIWGKKNTPGYLGSTPTGEPLEGYISNPAVRVNNEGQGFFLVGSWPVNNISQAYILNSSGKVIKNNVDGRVVNIVENSQHVYSTHSLRVSASTCLAVNGNLDMNFLQSGCSTPSSLVVQGEEVYVIGYYENFGTQVFNAKGERITKKFFNEELSDCAVIHNSQNKLYYSSKHGADSRYTTIFSPDRGVIKTILDVSTGNGIKSIPVGDKVIFVTKRLKDGDDWIMFDEQGREQVIAPCILVSDAFVSITPASKSFAWVTYRQDDKLYKRLFDLENFMFVHENELNDKN